MNRQKHLRSVRALAAALLALPVVSYAQSTGFNQTAAGTYDYNLGTNWVGGVINGVWDSSLTLAGAQTVTFGANTILSTGFTFNNAGNFAVTLRGAGNRSLTLGGDITVATTGGTGANVTIGSTTANQNLNVDLGGVTRTASVAASRTLSFANVVSNGGLTKTGAGTLTLTNANTFAGGLTLNEGTVNINNNAALGTGTLTINGGSINVNAARTLTNNNVQSWNSDFTFVGGNTLDLGMGDVAIAAPLTLTTTASTLTFGGTITSGNLFDITKAGAGTLIYTGNTALSANRSVNVTAGTLVTTGNITGGHDLTLVGAGTFGLRGATSNAAASAITANAGSTLAFDSSSAGVTGATRVASLKLKGAGLSVTGNGTANSIDTITGALTAAAPSTWGSPGANTVTVTAGVMNAQLSADSLVREGKGVVFFRGTNLGANTIASATAGTSNISFVSSPSAYLVGGGGAAGSQNISIIPWAVGSNSASGAPTSFVTYDANGIRPLATGEYDTTIPAASTDNNVKLDGTSLTTNGSVLLTVNGATTVNSLFLTNGSTSAQGQSSTILAGTGALTVTSGAIYMNFANGGNNNVTNISKPIDFGTAEGVIGTSGTSSSKTLSFSGGISGSGGITIYDTNVASSNQAGVSFGAANSYMGNTVINGSLLVSNTNALPNFTNSSRTGDVYVNGTMGLSGGVNIRMNGLWGNGRIITPFSSAATLAVGDNNATSTFGGTITQTTGVMSLTKVGTGTLTLSGTSSTYTGATTIQNGTLSAVTLNNVAAPLASSSLGRPITIANGTIGLGSATATGTLRVTGTGETTDRVINLAGTTGGGAIEQAGTGLLKFTSNFTATGTGAKTLTLTGSTSGTGEIAGSIVNSSGATSLFKDGTGLWTLSGANTYTGATTVNQGTLLVTNTTGSGTGSGAVSVASGAKFGGTGAVSGLVTASAANSTIIAGGVGSLGTLTLSGGFTAASGATFAFEVNGASVDSIDFGAGALDIDGVATVSFTSLGTVQTGSAYSLFAGSGDWGSVAASFVINAPTGYVLDSSFGGGNGYVFDASSHTFQVQFATAAVPEPSTFALLGGAAALLLAGTRRRRTSRSV